MSKLVVAVVFGGVSTEHEVSVISGLQSLYALDSDKYDAVPIYISKEGEWYVGNNIDKLEKYRDTASLLADSTRVLATGKGGKLVLMDEKKHIFARRPLYIIDVVLPVLHGSFGENGALQGLLDIFNVPYCGSNVISSAVGLNKVIFKSILKSAGISVVESVSFPQDDWALNRGSVLDMVTESLDFPVIIKPADQGSSIGIGTASNIEELSDLIDRACDYSCIILVEKLISNRKEYNCAVLGDRNESVTSAIEEPIYGGDMLDFSDKYEGGQSKGIVSTERVLPAELSDQVRSKIESLALDVFNLVSASGVSRIDFLLDVDSQVLYVNEINTIPGSLSFYLFEEIGVTFSDLLDHLVNIALRRSRKQDALTVVFDSNILESKLSGGKLGTKE